MKKDIKPNRIFRKYTLFFVCILLALTMMPQIAFAADNGSETVDPIDDTDKYIIKEILKR